MRWKPILCTLTLACLAALGLDPMGREARAGQLEALFPAQAKGVEVRRAPIDERQRAYLKALGVSDAALNLYADVFVKGYESERFRWGDLRPGDLGPKKIAFDTTGLRTLSPLPPPGVHPRVFFTDADRSEHRHRLEKTAAGKEAVKILVAYTELLKGRYDRDAFYAQPDTWKGSHGNHGFLPLMRAGGNNEANRAAWDAHRQGKAEGRLNIGLCALEAYRCWLHEDAQGARQLAKAVETSVRAALAKLESGKRPGLGSFNLNFVYDFIYNWLSDAQRDLLRRVIIVDNFDNNQYGCFQDAITTTSNWTTFSYRILSWIAIEGDPGWNELAYRGYVRGMHNFLTYGWFKAGPCFEGMGKNQLGGEILWVMARRGDTLAAHPHVLACLRQFLPHSIVPWGGRYIAYDLLGGLRRLNPNDIQPLKCLFPDDKRIDWVYRNCVHDDYSFMHGDGTRVGGWFNNALFQILFTVDYHPSNDDPAKLGLQESFFGPQRGLMITRSDWGKDALYLHHHVRGASGGHVFSDRNAIILAGKGRMWFPNGSRSQITHQNSTVIIDGRDLPASSAARMIDYQRTPLATFSCGDAAPAWNWEYKSAGSHGQYTAQDAAEGKITIPEGWEANTSSFNDFAYEKENLACFTSSYFTRPDWLKPGRIMASVRRRSGFQVKRAFRSAGIVRGTYPYALIVDDYEAADGAVHDYDWIARLERDLALWKTERYTLKNGKPTTKIGANDRVFSDVFLVGRADANEFDQYGRIRLARGMRVLLVRFLQCDAEAASPATIHGHAAVWSEREERRLVVSTRTRRPNFKVLVYPYRHAQDPVPATQWEPRAQTLRVVLKDQVDTVVFSEQANGRTAIEIRRETAPGETASFVFGKGNDAP